MARQGSDARSDQFDAARLPASARRMLEQLTASLEENKRRNRELETEVARLRVSAATDPLTGIINRRALVERAEELFASAARYGWELACLVMDVDGLKQVNDQLGHEAGDELLRIVAEVLVKTCRRSDVVGRLGGDEFVALLPHTAAPHAKHVAERIAQDVVAAVVPIQARIDRAFRGKVQVVSRGRKIPTRSSCRGPLGLSIGISTTTACRPTSAAQLLAQADTAMYESKRAVISPGGIRVPSVFGVTRVVVGRRRRTRLSA